MSKQETPSVTSLAADIEALCQRVDALEKPRLADERLTRAAAAQVLGISVRKLDDLRRCGELACIRVGRRVLFAKAALDAFARTHVQRRHGRREGSRRA